MQVGGFPNGLAFDPSLGHLIAANVAKQDDPTTVTASIVDVEKMSLIADVLVPGRTRWTVFDKWAGQFYINISKPSQIVAINSRDPHSITTVYEIPATGPHGLDLDSTGRRLFCACDDGGLFTVQLNSRKVASGSPLSGAPDVIFYNEKKRHLYVAIGNPGVIDVVDTEKMLLVQTVKTELGAHTIAYNPESDKIYAFLPETHRASVYKDE